MRILGVAGNVSKGRKLVLRGEVVVRVLKIQGTEYVVLPVVGPDK